MGKFKFSVIIPVYNVEEYLEETVTSIIDQSIGFKENIQLILINDGSPDNSEKVCLKFKQFYPENVIYVCQENSGVSVARNKGIELAEGEFTTFLDSDDKWSLDSFEEVYHQYQKHKDVSIYSCQMRLFDYQTGNHPLNYKYKEDKVVNILEEYNYPQLSSSSIFIKTSVLKNYRYDVNVKYSEDNKLINEILFDELKIMMLKKPIYYYRKRMAGTSAIQGQTMNINWYLVTPKEVYRYLFDLSKKKFGRVIEYIQFLVGYDLFWRIRFNTKMEMNDEEKALYSQALCSLIHDIDDELILENHRIDFVSKIFLLNIKYDENMIERINYSGENLLLENKEFKLKTLGFLIFDQIYIRHGKCEFYGKLDRKFIPEEKFDVLKNNQKINVDFYKLTNDHNEVTFTGENLHDYIGIHFVLNVEENWKLEFKFGQTNLYPRFKRSSIFTEDLPRSYHHEKNRTIVLKNNTLVNQRRNVIKSFIYEICDEFALIKMKKNKALYARFVNKIANIFKHKEIWLISDRVDKADDNGEHFFKYMVENHPEKDVYYVLTEDSVDYERLSKIGKVIDPNSNKYKILFYRSDYVVSAHAENYIFNPLGQGGRFILDQSHYKYVFLQHGITKDDLSPWLNVNTKKMNMFVTAAVPEYQSLLDCDYYYGNEVVKLTGFPRYDSLLKKQKEYKTNNTIMLSCTWRNSLASRVDKNTGKRVYNREFKNSDYFKFLNNLMNDEKLLNVLQEKNYKIRFIPHPNVLGQLEDFTRNEFIEIEEGSINYQKEFCENKLLITDYSSVFFDFAYLNKPVIYYQADRTEFFEGQLYNQGYFDYKEMGFGPVLEDYDSFVDQLIKMIQNDCVLDEIYERRIEQFFKFHDDKNCERVYNEIVKL